MAAPDGSVTKPLNIRIVSEPIHCSERDAREMERNRLAETAPISLEQAEEYYNSLTSMSAITNRTFTLSDLWARMRYDYADAMLRTRELKKHEE